MNEQIGRALKLWTPGRRARWGVFLFLMVVFLLPAGSSAAMAKSNIEKYLKKVAPQDLAAGATAFGKIRTDPPYAEILKDGARLGYAFLTTDYVNAAGYSGKPIHIAVGMDETGVITGSKLVKHSEPIVLIGIPEHRIITFLKGYTGLNAVEMAGKARDAGEVDMISGATVTVMVIEDSIFRAAIKFARKIGLAGLSPEEAGQKAAPRSVNMELAGVETWQALLRDGSVRRRHITIKDINEAFAQSGNPKAAALSEQGKPDETYIDLYMAPVSVPVIGRSLLGNAEYQNMLKVLGAGQQALLVFANGRYSFKGSGYVRGGIFDRIQIIQGEESIRFRDKYHKRLGEVMAQGAPAFKEVGLFRAPLQSGFNAAQPFRLELLVSRATNALKKAFLAFDLEYDLPEKYLNAETSVPVPQAAGSVAGGSAGDEDLASRTALWKRMWALKAVDAVILIMAIGVLTLIFFFQNWLVKRHTLFEWVRNGFMLFTVVWIGFYAQVQLSIVNVFTFFSAFTGGFRWDYFLMEPMIFILWLSVAASLLFWGRGAYCGWLCPFGTLQELLNKVAVRLNVPQYRVPWEIHERLWPFKYIIFMGLFGLSLYSLSEAEKWAEIEPFKTSIVLMFVREWPYVIYALTLLAVGLFIERFFCRYLCPLGAALAIPARIRMFDWLKRYKECGAPCQRCANECGIQAIHPEGNINPNECLSCLHCQKVYFDEFQCPPMITRRLKRERRSGGKYSLV